MKCLSNAEKEVLKRVYPEGCRVELEHMGEDPYSKREPGDLGNVMFIDDTGTIHVSWDRGENLGLVYELDRCSCIMEKEHMEEILENLGKMQFENLDKMEAWIEENLLSAFPKLSFGRAVNNEMVIELGCGAFKMQNTKMSIQFIQDVRQRVFVKKCELKDGVPEKKKQEKNRSQRK